MASSAAPGEVRKASRSSFSTWVLSIGFFWVQVFPVFFFFFFEVRAPRGRKVEVEREILG